MKYRLTKLITSYVVLVIIGIILVAVYNIATMFAPLILKIIYAPVPPKIVSTNPTNETSNVELSPSMYIQINKPLDSSTINIDSIKLKKQKGNYVEIELVEDDGRGNMEEKEEQNRVIQFEPSNRLEPFTKYVLEVDATVRDISGRSITEDSGRLIGSFTTGTGLGHPDDRTCSSVYRATTDGNNVKWSSINITNDNAEPSKISACMRSSILSAWTNQSNSNSTIRGLDTADKFYGSNKTDFIYGLGGNDTVYGGDGNDIIAGGDGGDYLSGRNDNDVIYAGDNTNNPESTRITQDIIYAGIGNDKIISDGYDMIDCGDGSDTVDNAIQTKHINCEKIVDEFN